MTSIAIFGGTGYAGSLIAQEARKRGFDVTVISRSASGEGTQAGSFNDDGLVTDVVKNHDVVVSALHPDALLANLDTLIEAAAAASARVGVVGGAGTALTSPDGPQLIDTPEFPAEFKGEARLFNDVVDKLTSSPENLDWFLVHPAVLFGSYAPGETLGTYRTDGDVLVTKEDGSSEISGTDYALAFVDEIASPAHHRRRFTVGH